MRAAPSVRLCCADGGAWHSVQVLLIGASTASFGFWLLAWSIGAGVLAALGALVAGTLAALLAWRSTLGIPRQLQWDGAQWGLTLRPASAISAPCEVTLIFDLGGWMMLRAASCGPQGKRVDWLPVSRRAAGPAWHGLRVALHMQGASLDASDEAPDHDLIR